MKRIIICCDGTWNEPDQEHDGKRKPSNVIKILRAVKPLTNDNTVQVVHYQIGVGTGRGSDRWLGGGTGLGLSIVRRYVTTMGGRVWLESDGRTGTTAFVELPSTTANREHLAA